jgi:hypothetical protein
MSGREYSGRDRFRPVQGKRDFADAASRSVERAVRVGSEDYDRSRHLPRLIPIEPALLADGSVDTRRFILARLARALRAERNRGRAGHWTYDLNRHIGLMQAYAAEKRIAAKCGNGNRLTRKGAVGSTAPLGNGP